MKHRVHINSMLAVIDAELAIRPDDVESKRLLESLLQDRESGVEMVDFYRDNNTFVVTPVVQEHLLH